jgi:hypothetical protein
MNNFIIAQRGVVNFAIAKVLRFTTNKIKAANAVNDNVKCSFGTDFTFDFYEEFTQEETTVWEAAVDYIIKDTE